MKPPFTLKAHMNSKHFGIYLIYESDVNSSMLIWALATLLRKIKYTNRSM